MKNAIGYVRVSTEGQAQDDRYGIEAQKESILRYAEKNGYDIIQWYQDEMSGATDNRPALDEILYNESLSGVPFEAVIAYKSDRIARDTKLYFYYLYTLEKRNIKLISTQEDFAEGSEFANIYRALMMFVAEQERKNIALRTGNGRSVKAAAGGYAGGRPPFGYKIVNGQYEIEPEEAELVRTIFYLKSKNYPMLKIAEMLTDSGYRTRSGGHWYASGIKSILENERTYRGEYKYGKNGQWVKGIHQPILEND